MKTLKNLFLTILFATGLVSTASATKDTIRVANTTQIYHLVAGNPVLVTSINVNVGDTIVVENWSTITADFTMNTTTFTNICGTMCDFQYKVLPTDVPSFTITAFVPLNSTTYNLITVYVNNITTGISVNTNKIGLEVYPNPVLNELMIKSDNQLGEVSIFNISGQLIFEDKVEDNTTKVDFHTYSSGVYFVRVGDKVYKIIKQTENLNEIKN
jgi:hypothetical protein